jgi:hypothetical protein
MGFANAAKFNRKSGVAEGSAVPRTIPISPFLSAILTIESIFYQKHIIKYKMLLKGP